jgi:hypothetical protein
MAKMCRYYPAKRCYHDSCSVFDCASGLVTVCGLHPYPSGFFAHKKVVRVLQPLFSKHFARRG